MRRRRFIQVIIMGLTAVGCKLKSGNPSSSLTGADQDEEFDYIIVGSGAGGGPLAVNLSKNGFRVLLLEAGIDQGEREVYRIPAFHGKSSEDEEMAWDFYVDHYSDKVQQGRDRNFVAGKGILYPRAGTLGGCTAHNAMIYLHPLRKDWDDLGRDVGDSSYNYKVMNKYSQLVERADYLSNSPQRKIGWLPINVSPFSLVLGDWGVISMIASAATSFFPRLAKQPIKTARKLFELIRTRDVNADSPTRDTDETLVFVPQANINDKNGAYKKTASADRRERYGTRDHIKKNASSRLVVRTGCFVTRVLFDDSNPEDLVATGVEYIKGEKIYKASKNPMTPPGEKFVVKAKKEVVLACGAFNTPQLLLLSGIGPRSELENLAKEQGKSDFKIFKDLPGVGKNLQDRYEVGIVAQAKKSLPILNKCDFKINVSDSCYNDWTAGRGPYNSNGAIIGMLKKSNPKMTNPDLFIFLLAGNFLGYYPGYSQSQGRDKDKVTWAILKSHTHNKSGYVKLKSFSPFDTPEINFRYFHEGSDASGNSFEGDKSAQVDDLDAVVEGVNVVRSLIKSSDRYMDTLDTFTLDSLLIEPLAGRTPYFEEIYPAQNASTQSEVREFVRNNAWGHHASCSCKMGKSDDPNAVVDSKFKVFGTSNLRIVDASVFPRIPGYFIVSSVYAMSERATDEILEAAGKLRRVSV
jgi:choline dehydrogenase